MCNAIDNVSLSVASASVSTPVNSILHNLWNECDVTEQAAKLSTNGRN